MTAANSGWLLAVAVGLGCVLLFTAGVPASAPLVVAPVGSDALGRVIVGTDSTSGT
jgi:hypothetical protein